MTIKTADVTLTEDECECLVNCIDDVLDTVYDWQCDEDEMTKSIEFWINLAEKLGHSERAAKMRKEFL